MAGSQVISVGADTIRPWSAVMESTGERGDPQEGLQGGSLDASVEQGDGQASTSCGRQQFSIHSRHVSAEELVALLTRHAGHGNYQVKVSDLFLFVSTGGGSPLGAH